MSTVEASQTLWRSSQTYHFIFKIPKMVKNQELELCSLLDSTSSRIPGDLYFLKPFNNITIKAKFATFLYVKVLQNNLFWNLGKNGSKTPIKRKENNRTWTVTRLYTEKEIQLNLVYIERCSALLIANAKSNHFEIPIFS